MKTIIFSLGLLISTLAQAELYVQPEYGHPECGYCYEQQQLCYDVDGNGCTDQVIPCIKGMCTHYKHHQDRWYAL